MNNPRDPQALNISIQVFCLYGLFVLINALVSLWQGVLWDSERTLESSALIFSLAALLYLTVVLSKQAASLRLQKQVLIAVVLFSGLFWIEKIFLFPELRIWLDEYSQYIHPRTQKSILLGSTFDLQPPLGYINTFGSTTLFGTKITALKLPALLGHFFASISVLGLTMYFTKNYLLAFILALVFCFFPPLYYQGVEARNLSQMSFLFLNLLSATLVWRTSPRPIHILYVAVSSLLFLYSAGFQTYIALPLIFILGFLFSEGKINKKEVVTCGLIILISVVLLLPTLNAHITQANQYGTLDSSQLKSLWDILRQMTPSKIWSLMSEAHILYSFWVLIACLSLLILRQKINRKIFFTALSISVLFLSAVYLAYMARVNWSLSPRYYILTYLFLFVAIIYGLAVAKLFKNKNNKWTSMGLLIVLIVLAGETFYKRKYVLEKNNSYKADWSGVYASALELFPKGDHWFYILRLQRPAQWYYDVFVAPEFFINEAQRTLFRDSRVSYWENKEIENYFSQQYLAKDALLKNKNVVPVLVLLKGGAGYFKDLIDQLKSRSQISVYDFERYSFLTLKSNSQGDLASKGLALFKEIDSLYPNAPWRHSLLLEQVAIEYQRNNITEATRLFQELVGLPRVNQAMVQNPAFAEAMLKIKEDLLTKTK